MTRRLQTIVGAQGGLESSVESQQSQGFLVADNLVYRPVGGVSKRQGSRKLAKGKSTETRRLLMPSKKVVGDAVFSAVEENSGGQGKLLAYDRSGVRTDLFSLAGSKKVTLQPDVLFEPYTEIKLSFPDAVFSEDEAFVESAFEKKLGALDGFWLASTAFTTVAAEQDSVDPDLLRVSTFAFFPLLSDEVTLTATSSFSTPPSTSSNYDIVAWNGTFFTIYPTGSPAPSWTSTGDAGSIDFSLKSLKIIEVDDVALATESLTGTQTKVFFEVQGEVPSDFSLQELTLPEQDRSGEEIVFGSDLGQMWVSDESPTAPKVSYYGVPRAIDAVPFCYQPEEEQTAGPLGKDRYYAYCAVFKKTLNGQVFLGAPSPFFTLWTDAFYGVIFFSGSINSNDSLVLTTLPDYGDETFLELSSVSSTPAIPDGSIFRAEVGVSGTSYLISEAEQIRVLGQKVTVFSGGQVNFCRTAFLSCAVPEELWEDYRREEGAYEYSVQIYRTVGVETGAPDYSQAFLVAEQQFPSPASDMILPHILAVDDKVPDFELESKLPLYTNFLEEGPLSANDLAPRYQASASKNGVFYAADLERKPSRSLDFTLPFLNPFDQTIEAGETAAHAASSFLGSGIVGQYYTLIAWKLTFSSASTTFGTFDSTLGPPGNNAFISNQVIDAGYQLCVRLDTLETFVGYVSGGPPTARELSSLQGDLNPTGASFTTKVIVVPLWVLDSGDLKLWTADQPSGFVTPEENGVLNIQTFYSLHVRSLNVSPSTVPPWAPSASSYLTKSNFQLFFDSSQTRVQEKISVRAFVERRKILPYASTFPPWVYFSGTTETFELEPARNQLVYSKPFEPAAFPALNFLNVGSSSNVVYGLFLVRESILVASSEGFYRLTGDQAVDYALTPIEQDTIPLGRLLLTEQQDTVFAMTQKGLCAATESNVTIIDAAVKDLVERFLSLYRKDISSAFSSTQLFSSSAAFLRQVTFFLPSLDSYDSSRSRWGLAYDVATQRFSTVDLYRDDAEKFGVLSAFYEATLEESDAFFTPSVEPCCLYQVRSETLRSDFADGEHLIELENAWDATGSVTAGSAVLAVETGFPHRLVTGDYVKLVGGQGDLLTTGGLSATDFQGVHLVTRVSDTFFQVTLPTAASGAASGEVTFRLGRQGLPGTLSLTSGSTTATLTFAAAVDAGLGSGVPVILKKPWAPTLSAAVSSDSDLEGEREVQTYSSGTLTFELSAPAVASFSGAVEWSASLSELERRAFGVEKALGQTDFSLVAPFSKQLFFPFSFEKRKATRLQGFLERPLPAQWKVDRPAKLFTALPSTLVTSRITGGDPCALKSYEQVVVALQGFVSCTKVSVAFQGDRYASAGGVEWVAQSLLEGPFDPAFGDVFWSAIFSQWASITAPSSGWKEATPYVPIRLTVPTETAQSTYLCLIMRHERPYESFALGSIAVNGTFIDPTGSGV